MYAIGGSANPTIISQGNRFLAASKKEVCYLYTSSCHYSISKTSNAKRIFAIINLNWVLTLDVPFKINSPIFHIIKSLSLTKYLLVKRETFKYLHM